MTETEANPRNSPDAGAADETVQKTFIKDLKIGEPIATVFKAREKLRQASRSGKPFLSLVLVDRTGQIDGRIFDNVDEANGAFAVGDYLLVHGTVGHFHGKPQLVVERLERLDPEPIDAKEYDYTPPPAQEQHREPAPSRDTDSGGGHKAARQRLLRLLDDPQIVQAMDALLRRFEKVIDERLDARLGHAPPARSATPRVERKRGPRGDRSGADRSGGDRPAEERKPDERKTEAAEKKPPRDPGLPEGLAFKPLSALVGDPPAGNSTPGANEG